MGLLDTILGRTKPIKPDLDELFALPSAAITLEAGMGLKPTGTGSVCVKPAEGGGFAGLREQIDQLLAADNDKYESSTDSFGFTQRMAARYGTHDRIAVTPASTFSHGSRWEGDRCLLWAARRQTWTHVGAYPAP